MFQNNKFTCLSCGMETLAASINAIPDNPYYRPSSGLRNRAVSGNGEEVYYSDSDEDDTPPHSQASSGQQNGINGHHVQGVKDMVLNSQKANISKVRQLIDHNLRKISNSKSVRTTREARLKESIEALNQFKEQLNNEYKALAAETAQLNSYESKLNNCLNQLNKLNLMDFSSLKTINDDCLFIRSKLGHELEKKQKTDLEKAVRQSTVKINFENTDLLLSNLKADNDTIFMKLGSTLENDPSLVYLTTFMLGKIFADKIGTHNTSYKEMIKNQYISDGLDSPQPLDDPTEYIDFIKSFDTNTRIGSETQRSVSNLGSETSRSNSPKEAEKEWKVVSKKEVRKAPLSFSDMAKKPGNPQVTKRVPFPEKTIAQTNRPHCYFKIQVDNDTPFRVVFEMRPDMAPKMVDNFIKLCKGLPDGRGYKGSKIFRAKMNDHILGGDFENDDGTGGHSAYEEKYFLAEQCPLKDHKGAIRMKGLERTPDGRCRIGSQFMIWVGDLEYKEYRFTLVFGKVVEGFEQLLEVSRIKAVQKSPTSWVLRQTVSVVESGVL